MPLVPLLKLLDTRPRSKAEASPVSDSVNIPLDELKERLSELPAKRVYLAETEGYSAAKSVLEAGGRIVEVCAPSYVKSLVKLGKKANGRLWSPSEYVVEKVSGLEPGVALDLGCGVGRDTSFLAAEGWKVIAVDNLGRTLSRAKKFVEFYSDSSQVTFVNADCVTEMPNGSYDLILTMMFYNSKLPHQILDRLKPGAAWLLEAYTSEYQGASGHPNSPDRSVSRNQLENLGGFDLQDCEEKSNRFLATLIKK